MIDIYILLLYAKLFLIKNKFNISVIFNNLGVGAYVAAFLELIKGNINANVFLMAFMGIMLTYISQTLKIKHK